MRDLILSEGTKNALRLTHQEMLAEETALSWRGLLHRKQIGDALCDLGGLGDANKALSLRYLLYYN
jgi:hypothetical protein